MEVAEALLERMFALSIARLPLTAYIAMSERLAFVSSKVLEHEGGEMMTTNSAEDIRASLACPGRSKRRVVLACIGLLLALGLPELGLVKLLFEDTAVGARVGHEIVWIGFGALMLCWVSVVERLPLASIGLRSPTLATFGWGLAGTLALLATMMLSFAVVIPALGLHQDLAQTSKLVQVPLPLLLLTTVVAGTSEEILYRGYAIERIAFLTGSRLLGGLMAGAAFVAVHLSWGPAQLVVVTLGTLVFVGLYLWRRDLPCVMIAHVLADLVGFLLARAQT